jgi:hypothetical protein
VNDAIREFALALPSHEYGSIHYEVGRLYRKNGNIAAMKSALEISERLHKERLDQAHVAMAAIQQASSPLNRHFEDSDAAVSDHEAGKK